MKDDTLLFAGFSLGLAHKTIDEFFSVLSPAKKPAKDEIKQFIAFNAILQREFVKKMLAYDSNSAAIYERESKNFTELF